MSNMRAVDGTKTSSADWTNSARLEDLDDNALYWLLGDAWYAQLHPIAGSGLYLAPSAEVGKREFDAVAPTLRAALAQPYDLGVLTCVAHALRTSGAGWMPASVVGVLAVRQGFTLHADRRAPADVQEAYPPA